MRIVKIITEWEDGERVSIEEPEVTQFLEAGGNKNISMYLLLAFTKNLAGGLDWKKEVSDENTIEPPKERETQQGGEG